MPRYRGRMGLDAVRKWEATDLVAEESEHCPLGGYEVVGDGPIDPELALHDGDYLAAAVRTRLAVTVAIKLVEPLAEIFCAADVDHRLIWNPVLILRRISCTQDSLNSTPVGGSVGSADNSNHVYP